MSLIPRFHCIYEAVPYIFHAVIQELSWFTGEGVEANLQRLAKGAAKKKVLRPQPKLNGDRYANSHGMVTISIK